jgi:hypothetical protein
MSNCMSFRELRRQTKLVRLKTKARAIGVSSETLAILNHSCELGEATAAAEPEDEKSRGARERFEFFVNTLTSLASQEINNEKLSSEEREGLDIAFATFQTSIDQLSDLTPFDERAYFWSLEWALRSAHHIGTACEEIPKQWIGPGKTSQLKRLQAEAERRKTEPGRKKLLELRPRQKRLEIMEPLVVEAHAQLKRKGKRKGAPSIAKYIRPALEKELKARGMPIPKPDTIRSDVEDIMKDSWWVALQVDV